MQNGAMTLVPNGESRHQTGNGVGVNQDLGAHLGRLIIIAKYIDAIDISFSTYHISAVFQHSAYPDRVGAWPSVLANCAHIADYTSNCLKNVTPKFLGGSQW